MLATHVFAIRNWCFNYSLIGYDLIGACKSFGTGTMAFSYTLSSGSQVLYLFFLSLTLWPSFFILQLDGRLDGRAEAPGDSREKLLEFGFDYCYWSVNPEAPNYASQEEVSIISCMFNRSTDEPRFRDGKADACQPGSSGIRGQSKSLESRKEAVYHLESKHLGCPSESLWYLI